MEARMHQNLEENPTCATAWVTQKPTFVTDVYCILVLGEAIFF